MTAEIVISSAAGLAAIGAVYQAGRITGRFDKHETAIERRVDVLEKMNEQRITREELTAHMRRLEHSIRDSAQASVTSVEALRSQIDTVMAMLRDSLNGKH